VGVSGEIDVLQKLQQSIDSELAPIGFTADTRKFTPHLTLARVREQVSQMERQGFGQLIYKTSFESEHGIQVNEIQLMRSQLTRQGAIYSRTNTVALMKGQ